jgi:hypothetical protein
VAAQALAAGIPGIPLGERIESRAAKPKKPRIIIAEVDGSGTAPTVARVIVPDSDSCSIDELVPDTPIAG